MQLFPHLLFSHNINFFKETICCYQNLLNFVLREKSYLIFIGFIALTVSGCRKEPDIADTLAATDVQANQNSFVSDTSITSQLRFSRFKTSYGSLIGPPEDAADPYSFIMNVAGKLGISCLRDGAPVPGSKRVETLTSGYKVLLNFSTRGEMPLAFRTDTSAYQNDLRTTLSVFTAMPTIAVIENEESNIKYFSGTAIEYVNQLKAAITVMHSYNIPVANGGLTYVGLEYLVYQDYISRGMITEANDFQQRTHLAVNASFTIDRGNYIGVLLDNYAVMDLDFINFHWRSESPADAEALGEIIDYLKRVTRKPVITTEIGQYDQDPATLTATVQMCKNYRLPFFIWYSDTGDTRSYPLQYANEALTTTGNSYKDFISANK